MLEIFEWTGSLKMPQVVIVTSLLAAFFSVVTIRSSRKTVRQKNAIDLMMDFTKSDTLVPSFALLRSIHNDTSRSIETLAKGEENSEDKRHTRLLLNYLENVAIGIRNGIYDEQIIRDNRRTLILHTWEMALPFVERQRSKDENKHYYEHLEWLVCRFKSQPPRLKCLWVFCRFFKMKKTKIMSLGG